MLKFADQRQFPRINVECPARFRALSELDVSGAIVKNLSGSGMLMSVDHPLEVGTRMVIEVYPKLEVTPPLFAEVEVVRQVETEEGDHGVACRIERILGKEEVSGLV